MYLFSFLVTTFQLLALTTALWPVPSSYTNGTSVVFLSPNVKTVYTESAHSSRSLK